MVLLFIALQWLMRIMVFSTARKSLHALYVFCSTAINQMQFIYCIVKGNVCNKVWYKLTVCTSQHRVPVSITSGDAVIFLTSIDVQSKNIDQVLFNFFAYSLRVRASMTSLPSIPIVALFLCFFLHTAFLLYAI